MVFYYIVYNVCNYLLTVLKELRSKTLYHWINIVSRKKKIFLKKKSKSIRSEKTYDKRVQYVQLYIFLNYTFIDKNILVYSLLWKVWLKEDVFILNQNESD